MPFMKSKKTNSADTSKKPPGGDRRASAGSGKPRPAGLSKDVFGKTNSGDTIDRYTLRNKRGMEMQVITLGAAITSLRVPDATGRLDDVILGFDDAEGYTRKDNPYMGAVLGRYAGRINRGIFNMDGSIFYLATNEGQNHLHGGHIGFDKALWKAHPEGDRVTFSHVSPDGDEDYPGEVRANVTYTLTEDDEVVVRFMADVLGRASPINLSLHPYFNLAGQGNETINDHVVQIFADKYLPVSKDSIPTGEMADVAGSSMDFRNPVPLSERLVDQISDLSSDFAAGYDHCFCLPGPTGRRFAARVSHPPSGRVMEVYTDQQGLQFYTGNFLNVLDGKNGSYYGKHHAFCLQPMGYPDAMNHENFPDCILRPGSTYTHTSWFRFRTLSSVHGY